MKKILFILFFSLLFLFGNIKTSFAALVAPSNWTYDEKSLMNEWDGAKASFGNLGTAQFTQFLITTNVSVGGVQKPIADSRGNIIGYHREGGILGSMEKTILAMNENPGGVSTKDYIADLGHSLGIVPKEAYAQGAGFTGLSPVLPIWKVMRDFAYMIYVLVFFVVGFMILLRKKIDPRTVISVEAALPKLIISLILITFSYAIISFMVDIANLACRIIGGFFIGVFLKPNGTTDFNEITRYNIFALIRPIGDAKELADQVGGLFQTTATPTGVPAFLANLSTWAIFSFAMLFITFKIFFSLLGPFVGIVLSVIFAPFQLLMSAIPGSEASLGSWLKGILAKVAVFPVVFFLLLIAATFGARSTNGLACTILGCIDWGTHSLGMTFQDSMNNNLNLVMTPLGNWSTMVGNLVAFGILFTIPAAAQLVQNALKVKDQGGDIAQQTIMRGMSKVPGLKGLAEK